MEEATDVYGGGWMQLSGDFQSALKIVLAGFVGPR
jgi:hypothetical protein